MGGDSERALADGCCCGEWERDLLLDLDLDLASPLPFSFGDRDLDLDLDRDFSDFSLDLLCEREPLSDLGLDLLFDLDFLLLDRERERSLLRDLDLDRERLLETLRDLLRLLRLLRLLLLDRLLDRDLDLLPEYDRLWLERGLSSTSLIFLPFISVPSSLSRARFMSEYDRNSITPSFVRSLWASA